MLNFFMSLLRKRGENFFVILCCGGVHLSHCAPPLATPLKYPVVIDRQLITRRVMDVKALLDIQTQTLSVLFYWLYG